jgi:hypothetical protein
MAKVKCIVLFHDLVDNVIRNVGDEWECEKSRADVLNERALVHIISIDEVVTPSENKVLKPSYKKK